MRGTIASMSPLLRRKEIRLAFQTGMEQLAAILRTEGTGASDNELPDEIIEEKGV